MRIALAVALAPRADDWWPVADEMVPSAVDAAALALEDHPNALELIALAEEDCPRAVEKASDADAPIPTAVEELVEAVAPLAVPVTKLVPRNWPDASSLMYGEQIASRAAIAEARTNRLSNRQLLLHSMSGYPTSVALSRTPRESANRHWRKSAAPVYCRQQP